MADIVKIEMVDPYSGSYHEVVEQGRIEVERGVQPAIKSLVVNWKDYDVVAVGTPTWWHTTKEMLPLIADSTVILHGVISS